MRVAFATLGCKVNQYDTQAMIARVEAAGQQCVPFEAQADAYVINTCTVTAQSDQKARQLIGRARRLNDQALIIACGCYAQRDAAHVLSLDGVDAVLGTAQRAPLVSLLSTLQKGEKRNAVDDFEGAETFEEGCGALFERTRAHLKIQDGCDRHCTYCIIPKARGPIRSRSVTQLVEECEAAAQAGHYEIVLTGIRLTAFGKERGETLMDSVEQVAKTAIGRIRLGSLDPDEVDDSFIKRAARCEKLCHHFHLSAQSGSDTVLRRMARQYTVGDFERTVEKLRIALPDASFSTDLMVGFVGETEAEFEQTMAFAKRIGFMRLHVFPYSKREGTAAARMPGHLPSSLKQQRAAQLIALGETLEQAYAKDQIGKRAEVVWEQVGKDGIEGYGRDYVRIRGEAKHRRPGDVCEAIIKGCDGAVCLV